MKMCIVFLDVFGLINCLFICAVQHVVVLTHLSQTIDWLCFSKHKHITLVGIMYDLLHLLYLTDLCQTVSL